MKLKDLHTGDILLESSKGFLPEEIQDFQGNKYNHAGQILVAFGKVWVIEAIRTGIAFTNFDEYIAKVNERKCSLLILRHRKYDWSKVPLFELMNFALPYTKTPYELSNLFIYQFIRFVSKKIFGKEIWIGRKNKKQAEKSFICGEWVGFFQNHFIGNFPKWYKIAPVNIFDNEEYNHFNFKA